MKEPIDTTQAEQKPRRRRRYLLAGACATALVIAGCGGASGYGTTAPKPSSSPATGNSASGAPLDVVADPKLGKIVVDGKGRTLYDFVIDKGTTSVCYGACASLWPPYTTKGAPKAGAGVSASLIGTTKRRDGSTEVTYGGHPLYYYAPDTQRGQTTGQALNQFGAPWYVLSPAGREIHAGTK
jgi:predicted lipoprotein with Yx(FWY)xxD motif